jgi:GNAT superfamily N-acetyltransferase
MSAINYDNRYFVGVSNAPTGQVDASTRFHYRQRDDILWGTYQGGAIRFGTLTGAVAADGSLDFAYQHVDSDGALRSGVCHSTPEVLPDGRVRLHERWQWTGGDRSSGESVVEEVQETGLGDGDLAPITQTRGAYSISTDPARLDLDAIHGYISRSYWATGRPRAIMERALRHSLNFGVYHSNGESSIQVGLARVVSDYSTYLYLCDVFILEEHQGQGLGKWLLEVVTAHPALQTIRRWMLATRDAHGLYSQYGFAPLAAPDRHMERLPFQP